MRRFRKKNQKEASKILTKHFFLYVVHLKQALDNISQQSMDKKLAQVPIIIAIVKENSFGETIAKKRIKISK